MIEDDTTTVQVGQETWTRLNIRKNKKHRTFNAVIAHLLDRDDLLKQDDNLKEHLPTTSQ